MVEEIMVINADGCIIVFEGGSGLEFITVMFVSEDNANAIAFR